MAQEIGGGTPIAFDWPQNTLDGGAKVVYGKRVFWLHITETQTLDGDLSRIFGEGEEGWGKKQKSRKRGPRVKQTSVKKEEEGWD